MTVKAKPIDEATANIIARNCIASGNQVKITAQLARPDYEAVNKVLTGSVAKHGFTFAADCTQIAIARVNAGQQRLCLGTVRGIQGAVNAVCDTAVNALTVKPTLQ